MQMQTVVSLEVADVKQAIEDYIRAKYKDAQGVGGSKIEFFREDAVKCEAISATVTLQPLKK